MGKAHLDAYLAWLDRRRKVAAVRLLFGFLHRHGTVATDPTARLIPPEREHNEPRVLTEAEYQRLQRACATVPRDAALIEVLLQTGMRVGEVAVLQLADLVVPPRLTHEHTGAVRVRGQGRKDRTVTLNAKALKALTAYLAVRPAVDIPAVFVSKFHRPLTIRAIRRVMKHYMAEAGIEQASVHTLRHRFATHHVRKGTSLRVVQEALGRASMETTGMYVHLARADG